MTPVITLSAAGGRSQKHQADKLSPALLTDIAKGPERQTRIDTRNPKQEKENAETQRETERERPILHEPSKNTDLLFTRADRKIQETRVCAFVCACVCACVYVCVYVCARVFQFAELHNPPTRCEANRNSERNRKADRRKEKHG